MIVVTVQLVSARTGQISTLGKMVISNDGTSRVPSRGSYDVAVHRKTADIHRAKPIRTARVEKYARLAYPVWELVRRALNAAYGKDDLRREDYDETRPADAPCGDHGDACEVAP